MTGHLHRATASPIRRARRRKTQSPKIQVIVQSARWRTQPGAENTVKKAIRAAARAVSTPPAELAIVLGDDSAIRALNRDWRGKNAPTNVLSFPAPVRGRCLGDLVICPQVLRREARAAGTPERAHWMHLVIHGALHLIGYDHERAADARRMERREVRLLRALGVANPYRAA